MNHPGIPRDQRRQQVHDRRCRVRRIVTVLVGLSMVGGGFAAGLTVYLYNRAVTDHTEHASRFDQPLRISPLLEPELDANLDHPATRRDPVVPRTLS